MAVKGMFEREFVSLRSFVRSRWCHYGIGMARRAELVGADLSVEEIRAFVDADSLHYISLDGLIDATPSSAEQLCAACFTGRYPIPVPGEDRQLAQIALELDVEPVELDERRLDDAREGATPE